MAKSDRMGGIPGGKPVKKPFQRVRHSAVGAQKVKMPKRPMVRGR